MNSEDLTRHSGNQDYKSQTSSLHLLPSLRGTKQSRYSADLDVVQIASCLAMTATIIRLVPKFLFGNVISLEILFRYVKVVFSTPAYDIAKTRTAVSRTSTFQNSILERAYVVFNNLLDSYEKEAGLPLFSISICPFILLFFFAIPVSALELWSDPDTGQFITLDTTLKLTGLGVYTPEDDVLYPKRFSATALTRGRLDFEANQSERVTAEIAYEHRANIKNQAAGIGFGGGALAVFATPPWRIEALDWQILRHDDTFSWRHEIDRAQVTLRPDWGTVTIGRQAIGYGRGVMFSAVDVFAPFSPAEVDREWRRGVDAVRVEYQTSSLTSLDVTSVVGSSWEESAMLARFRGYVGDIDGAFIAGKRRRDAMFATAMSAVLG